MQNTSGNRVDLDLHMARITYGGQCLNEGWSGPYPATDGSNAYCLDNTSKNGWEAAHFLTSGGATPLDAEALRFR